jgi:hypothetical protein
MVFLSLLNLLARNDDVHLASSRLTQRLSFKILHRWRLAKIECAVLALDTPGGELVRECLLSMFASIF